MWTCALRASLLKFRSMAGRTAETRTPWSIIVNNRPDAKTNRVAAFFPFRRPQYWSVAQYVAPSCQLSEILTVPKL
jgi:hypothetical protein